jgi:FkbM family methyltransferase
MNIKLAVRNLVLNNPSFAIHSLARIKKIIRQFGFDINDEINTKTALLSEHDINVVLDVGANTGQYGMRSRIDGYQGKIISFEPLASAFAELCRKAKQDSLWLTSRSALGDYDGKTVINVSKKSVFSSILERSSLLAKNHPDSDYLEKEQITIAKLDTIFQEYCQPEDNIFLKIDTQGYEKNVLAGASNSLDKITGLQLEVSLKERLYQGELLMQDVIDFLAKKGFTLVSLEPLHGMLKSDLLQADALFFRI